LKISGSHTGTSQLNNVTDLYIGVLHEGMIHDTAYFRKIPQTSWTGYEENYIKIHQPMCQEVFVYYLMKEEPFCPTHFVINIKTMG